MTGIVEDPPESVDFPLFKTPCWRTLGGVAVFFGMIPPPQTSHLKT